MATGAAAVIFDACEESKKWQTKEGGLKLLSALAQGAPSQVSACLPVIVPLVSDRMVDAREQVRPMGSSTCTGGLTEAATALQKRQQQQQQQPWFQ